MSSNGMVVVLEGRYGRDLVHFLARWGYSIIVVENMIKALRRIERYDPAAAIVNGNETVDALEFVLNVRELNRSVPIIIVRPSIEEDMQRILRGRSDVYFISSTEEDFHSEMRDLIEKASA